MWLYINHYLSAAAALQLISAFPLIHSFLDKENTAAVWAFIDGVRSILIFNDFNPNDYSDIVYRYSDDGYNSVALNVNPETWTTIQHSEKQDVRQADVISITKSSRPQFPYYFFYNFFQVNKFEMTNQGISKISVVDFDRATKLTHLNVSHNAIETIVPYTFVNAKHLVVIDLSYNAISSIVGEIFVSDFLEELYLHYNNLTYIEFFWLNLKKLKVLTLHNNQIITIDQTYSPFEINAKHVLTLINISNNPMTPSESNSIIFHATNVDISNINARKCIITPTTNILNAHNNHINKIETFGAAVNFSLTELDVSFNMLPSIESLAQFIHLEHLNLSHNELDTLNGTVMRKMEKLKRLDLSNNRLSTIDFGFLRNTNNLIFLDLSFNEMLYFRLNAISVSLEVIHIENNKITFMDTNLKRMAPRLTHIGLNGNNWKCNYLLSVVLLFQFDGISPVLNDANVQTSEENVKGISCHSDDDTNVTFDLDTVRENSSSNGIMEFVNDYIEHKFQEMKIKLEKSIDDRFIQIVSSLNVNYKQNAIEPSTSTSVH